MFGLFDCFYAEVAIDRMNMFPEFKEMLPFALVYVSGLVTGILRNISSLPVFHPNYLSIVDGVVNQFFQLFYDVVNFCSVSFSTDLRELYSF